MSDTPGAAPAPPLRVAIVGSGPAGFYTAEALLGAGVGALVDLYERLPAPFGLVRYGVAPDHPQLKAPAQLFDRIARSDGVRFVGHVAVGTDLPLDALLSSYHAVVLAHGAQAAQPLAIPGADLPGSHSAASFVGWYNGHPDHAQARFHLGGPHAVVLGHGNVAVDICRILASPVDALRHSDIAAHALDALARSRITDIHLVGRRGPAQASFSTRELRELAALADVSLQVLPDELALGPACTTELADPRNTVAPRNLALLQGLAPRAGARKRIHLRFRLAPQAVQGDGRVQRLQLARTQLQGPPFAQRAVPLDEPLTLPCDLLLASIGYRVQPLPGLALDAATGALRQAQGRVLDEAGQARPGLYAVGWAKRGPGGVIGSNRACALDTVAALLADRQALLATAKAGGDDLLAALAQRGHRVLGYDDWLALDALELAQGQARGRPRHKLASWPALMDGLAAGDAAAAPPPA